METTIIAGGRNFKPTRTHALWLINKLREIGTDKVVSGMAEGADKFGAVVAKSLGLEVIEFFAEWDKYGKMAGRMRNVEMAKVATSCILFPGGVGTRHMERTAHIFQLNVIKYEDELPPSKDILKVVET